jgi:phosphohistidine phosphatase
MALYLVQHGKSLPKDKDPEQGLSEEGIEEVKRIADVARGYGVHVDLVQHSVKKRARQTAELFAAALEPRYGVDERLGLKPMDDITDIAATLTDDADLMLCGHLPFMEKLTSFLITESMAKPVIRFQNGGIVCLEKESDTDGWIIKWTLMPHIE